MTRTAVDPAAFVAAIRSVVGPTDGKVALHEPLMGERERVLVDDCVRSGWVSSVGEYVNEFERRIAEVTGAAHAVVTASGTAALHVAFVVAGIGRDDEVLVPALTFVATAAAVVHAGAVPHFVDVDPATLAVDPKALRRHLAAIAKMEGGRLVNRTTGRRIAALVPVHPFGFVAPMPDLLAVAAEFGIPVIEDAAEGLGATLDGRAAGTFGLLGTLSFNGNKIVTTGSGGAILTDDAELARLAKHVSTTAKLPHPWRYEHDVVGYNYRMSNLAAALGLAQLERLDEFAAAKRALVARYGTAFAGLDGVTIVTAPAGVVANGWLATAILEDADADLLDAVLGACHGDGLLCRPAWTPLHLLAPYADCPRADMTATERLGHSIVNLPSSPALALRVAG
ncbi:MAG TPA: LegC family aminotransferase [Hyphomicrobiales bacterium]|nr:LegC family aminotransferase [Kaistiaceae bacterium]HQF29818.1 LegC family aminotransferase [Hyphomicrobiales bacterium]